MLAIVEIDIRHFIKPAFVPVAVDMASEAYEQCLIGPVPHEVKRALLSVVGLESRSVKFDYW
jgi:hypothetical protein